MTEPDPRSPGLARRLLLAVLVATVLGAGAAALAVRSNAHPAARPTPSASPAVDDVVPAVTGEPSPTPSVSTPTSSRRPSPSRKPAVSGTPRPSPSPSRVPLYVMPADGPCPYIDFTPLVAINTRPGADPTPSVANGTTGSNGGKAYTCKGYLGNTTIREICVEIYPDRVTAAASWAAEKSGDVTTGADALPGLGDDAIGFFIDSATGRYKVDVLKANMWLFVVLDHGLPLPATSAYKSAAVAVAGSILVKLPRQ